jgi:hypothetical protein
MGGFHRPNAFFHAHMVLHRGHYGMADTANSALHCVVWHKIGVMTELFEPPLIGVPFIVILGRRFTMLT